jgi:hypothetical protein
MVTVLVRRGNGAVADGQRVACFSVFRVMYGVSA